MVPASDSGWPIQKSYEVISGASDFDQHTKCCLASISTSASTTKNKPCRLQQGCPSENGTCHRADPGLARLCAGQSYPRNCPKNRSFEAQQIDLLLCHGLVQRGTGDAKCSYMLEMFHHLQTNSPHAENATIIHALNEHNHDKSEGIAGTHPSLEQWDVLTRFLAGRATATTKERAALLTLWRKNIFPEPNKRKPSQITS